MMHLVDTFLLYIWLDSLAYLCAAYNLLYLSQVMSNQEAVDAIKDAKVARAAAKLLTEMALKRKSSDDISCIVLKFQ